MNEKLLGFALILTRLSAFFLVLPVFGWRTVPVRIKVAATVLLTIFFGYHTHVSVQTSSESVLYILLLMLNETTYGLALGLMIALIFSVIQCAGRIIERQMGLAMAEVMDPLSGDRSKPLGSLLEMIFVLLFLGANGPHLLIQVIAESYRSFPVGTIPSVEVMTQGVMHAGTVMLSASLKLAAPMLAAFLMLLVVLAIMARIVPEMNILFVSMPLRVGLGIIMVMMFMPYIEEFLSEFSHFMNQLLPV